jgi:cytochrome b pre-mRNA-processing protein 3
LYEKICVPRADEDSAFWREGVSILLVIAPSDVPHIFTRTACHLPPTFQSWFTVTNLHIWLLTVRLRALPNPHADEHIQALIDHFFIDVEDRIRAILQPTSPSSPEPKPYTTPSHFYTNPNISTSSDDPKKNRGRAPDRLVTRQMRIFKEQWTGMGMAFDLGLVKGDMELAGAVWRNLLGARGARGIAYPPAGSASAGSSAMIETLTPTTFRRAVNLVGGLVEDPAKVDKRGLDVEEATDDHSGVHDFPPSEADKYVGFPETMVDVVTYVRRELQRLERIEDDVIIRGDLMALRFGKVKS